MNKLTIAFVIIVAAFIVYFSFFARTNPVVPTSLEQQTPSARSQVLDTSPEYQFLNFQSAGASPEDQKKHNDQVVQRAKESDHLSITECKADPLVLKVRAGTSFQIKNNDAIMHYISFGSTHIELPASKAITIIPAKTFAGMSGSVAYYCDRYRENSGIFLIEK